ncbi:hypothetical protein OFO99_36850, partial [Escherichia coli]|nr:hypothetical protein [Escherichia coli]
PLRVSGYRVYRYALPLVAPVRVGAGVLRRREGLLVRLEAGGASGWGEAAPLPGFSRETLGEAARTLREAKPRILGRELQEATI